MVHATPQSYAKAAAALASCCCRSLAGFDVFGARSFRFEDGAVSADGGIDVDCGGVRDRLCVNVTGLVPGHSYSFRVAALTDGGAWLGITLRRDWRAIVTPPVTLWLPVCVVARTGASTFSEQSPPARTLPVRPPTVVRNLTVEPASPGSVHLAWLPPEDDGGLPVIGHLVSRGTTSHVDAHDMVRRPAALIRC